MTNIDELAYIVEGHINKALSGTPLASPEVEALSAVRLLICGACVKDGQPCLNEIKRCCRCGCDMEAKSRVQAKGLCPIGKW